MIGTAIGTTELSTSFLLQLASAALRSCSVASIAALALAAFRVKATSLRQFTWTTVLYVALAMPFLQLLLPPLSVPMPSLLQSSAQPAVISHDPLPAMASAAPDDRNPVPQTRIDDPRTTPAPARPLWSQLTWSSIAAAAYFAVLAILFARVFVGMSLERRLRRASRHISDDRLAMRIARRARAHGLGFIPELAESDLISIPLTAGILRPTLLFPAAWRAWDDLRLDAIIAHEMSHVARRDSLTLRLSLFHRAIFWFSPLAWWLDHHLADLAERASDEAALACGVDRDAYARTLLNFFASLQGTRGRVWWQGVSMASAGRAEQRVERILSWKGTVAMSLKRSIAALVVLLAVPVVYFTASAQPSDRSADSRHPAGVEIAQANTPSTPAPVTHSKHGSHRSSVGKSYAYGYDDDLHYAVVSGSSDSFTMSGMDGDGEHVQELKKTIPGDFIWFRRDGKSYIIRDRATVQRARTLWAPQTELGKQQEELGRQQEELGKQQEELAEKMEQVRVDVPDMTKELDRLQAKLKQFGSSATSDQIAELQSEIGELQEKIGESQSKAGDQQSKLGEQMGALGEKQGKLGELQGKLGEQQGKLAEEAARKMKVLLDESLKNGAAQPEQ